MERLKTMRPCWIWQNVWGKPNHEDWQRRTLNSSHPIGSIQTTTSQNRHCVWCACVILSQGSYLESYPVTTSSMPSVSINGLRQIVPAQFAELMLQKCIVIRVTNLRAQIWFGCSWSCVYMNYLLNLPMWLPAFSFTQKGQWTLLCTVWLNQL